MDTKEAIEKLKELQKYTDFEDSHAEADEILCRLLDEIGCSDVVE